MIKTKESYYNKRRYSNILEEEVIPGGTLPEVTVTASGGSSSGSGFNWDGLTNILNIVGNSISNLFSPSSKWQNEMNSQLYQQEKRTNTILWVVIGLMVALGVVLLIRKH